MYKCNYNVAVINLSISITYEFKTYEVLKKSPLNLVIITIKYIILLYFKEQYVPKAI